MSCKSLATPLIFTALLSLYGCGGNSGSNNNPDSGTPSVNSPPVVNVTPSIDVTAEQTNIELTVTASDDKAIASYFWSQLSGMAVILQNTSEATASFTTPVVTHAQGPQLLVFNIRVRDNEGAEVSAQVNVNISPNNYAPTATISVPTTVESGHNVTLAATASDSDGSITSYQWSQTVGPSGHKPSVPVSLSTMVIPPMPHLLPQRYSTIKV